MLNFFIYNIYFAPKSATSSTLLSVVTVQLVRSGYAPAPANPLFVLTFRRLMSTIIDVPHR